MRSQRIRFLVNSLRYRKITELSPVFIAGVGGGGNTLLASLLHERYQAAGFADEATLYAPKNSPVHIPSTRHFERLSDFEQALNPPKGISVEAFGNALCNVYRRYIDCPDELPVILDKSPNSTMRRADLYLNAFPSSKLILVFREPTEHIEGLMRKWPIFRAAGIEATVAFWKTLHEDFIELVDKFPNRILFLNFDELLGRTEHTLEMAAQFAKLAARKEIKPRSSRNNSKGFALRNVVDGRIVVDKGGTDPAALSDLRPHCKSIFPLYEKLKTLSVE